MGLLVLLSGALGLLSDIWLPDLISLLVFYVLYVGGVFMTPVIHRAIIKGRRVYGKSSRNL
jgi:hypothetical protein